MAKGERRLSREKLTAGRVARFACPPETEQAFLWDADVRGLAVRATSSGTKSFVFQGRLGKRTIRTTIGRVTDWDIDNPDPARPGARQEARRLQQLIDRGIDPNDDRADKDMARETAKAEEQRRQRLTRDVWDQYVKERAPQWSQETLSKHQRAGAKGGESRKNSKLLTVAGPLTALLDLRLADLSAKRVAKWLQTERVKRSGATLLAFSHLRAFLRWVGEQEEYAGIVDPGVCEARLVRDAKPEARARNDCLQREQLKAWFAAVRMQHPIISAYLQCLLLTGARRSEMAELKWADVDLVWRTVTISGKTGARTIPLPPYCASLISALPRYSEYVFASQRGKEKRVVAPHNPHSRVLALAGISGLTVHGLRRSFATLAEWADPPAGVIAQIMGHAASATAEKHYKVRSVDFLRLWHERIEKWFLGEANISFTPPAAEGKRLQLVSEVAA